jgi:hypothetical protein
MIYLKCDGYGPQAFYELDWDSSMEYEADAGTTERGYLYEKLKWSRRTYRIIISADAILTAAGLDGLESFWYGTNRQISFNGTNYIDVLPAPGPFPKSRLENARRYPEVAFELKRIDPVSARATGEDLFS